jgi:hypothetical protein
VSQTWWFFITHSLLLQGGTLWMLPSANLSVQGWAGYLGWSVVGLVRGQVEVAAAGASNR